MAITFDPKKQEWTLRHRGLNFAVDAETVFDGPFATYLDDRLDYGEVRYVSAGWLDQRIVVIVWTPRGEDRHVISMRYCHAEEQKYWIEDVGLRPPGG